MRVVELSEAFGLDHLRLTERPVPEPGPGQVRVRLKAMTLNFRDYLIVLGLYNAKQPLPTVPGSDGAWIVDALGPGVTTLKAGDRVINCFFTDWPAGRPIAGKLFEQGLGSPRDGVMAEFYVFDEAALLKIPDHLDDAEAASIPCAGVTAWAALHKFEHTKPGDTVLVQGTGGVALFALQLAKLAGARVAITSRSNEKLARARALGADATVNYAETKEWGKAAREALGIEGFDHVIELGGTETLEQSVRSVRMGGTISLIGILSGPTASLNLPLTVMRAVRLQGVTVGSREDTADLLHAMTVTRMKPVVDQHLDLWSDYRTGLELMAQGGHFGKIALMA